MSVRHLYRTLPAAKRVCSYWRCQRRILRNLTRTPDGRLWHYGCLQQALTDHFQCQECFSNLNGTEVTLADFGEGRPTFGCSHCGSTQLKKPADFRVVPRSEIEQQIEATP